MNIDKKKYLVVVQCHLVMQTCSGYYCEEAFNKRGGGFAIYPAEKDYRTLHFTCGGCCGRAVHRKMLDVIRTIKKNEGITKGEIAVHLASCITKDNFHGPVCPHLDYLTVMIEEKLKLDLVKDTGISKDSERLRERGIYKS